MLKTILENHSTLIYDSVGVLINIAAIAWPFILLALIPLLLIWTSRRAARA